MKSLQTANATTGDFETFKNKPEFRKASKNMILSHVALSRVLESRTDLDKSKTAVILATNYGELAVTQEFLQTLCLSKMARPFLFQNSLHNATLGFLALQFGFTGPTLTLSNGPSSTEDAVVVAETLLNDGSCDHAIVISIDTVVPNLTSTISQDEAIATIFS